MYEVRFHGGHILIEIEARNSKEARKHFNTYISVKKGTLKNKDAKEENHDG